MRVGVVVVTYGCRRVSPYYVRNIFDSLSSHDGKLDVLFVDNMSCPVFINDIKQRCQEYSNDRVAFSCISEPTHLTLFQSINLGFHILRSAHEYNIMGYSANDVWLESPTGLREALNEFSDESVAIVSPQADFDNQPEILTEYDIAGTTPLKIKLGDLVNLHFILFSRTYLDAYNFRYPDILGSYGTENFLSFCAAAIGKKWVLCRRACLRNAKRDAIAPKLKQHKGIKGFMVMTRRSDPPSLSLAALINPGVPAGMGFQAFARNHGKKRKRPYYVDYDHALYDENGECKNPQPLLDYIKSYLFLPNQNYAARFEFNKSGSMLNF